MSRFSPGLTIAALVAAGAVVASSSRPRADSTAITLKVSHEAAPPGAVVQVKVRLTDPQPISTAHAVLSLGGLRRIEGIHLISPGDDAAGVAVVRGTDVAFSIISPRHTFGMDSNYPLLTVVVRIPDGVAMDTTFPIELDARSLQLLDPAGAPLALEVKSGKVVTAPSVTIHDVVPGSATLPAGSMVSVLGSNFQQTTEVDFDDGTLAQVMLINSSRIDVVLGETTTMDGMEVEAKNRDSRVKYFSYQRTARAGVSGEAVLNTVVPLFRRQRVQTATLRLSGATMGVAVQNLEDQDAIVAAELPTPAGVIRGTLTVPPNTFVVRAVPEIFGGAQTGDAEVRLTSATAVQVLGVVVDSVGAAIPRLPL